ncbi:MAG: bifunctional diaminohydroxyphosphoribosylaminopyrimidine deaminase/5-amino-6-(5-phosphoribosylamino)uracil reductase RibD [Isosphaeraceae bacterium]
MPSNSQDSRWMRLALAEAARGRGLVEPNPMVGAVIVRDNQPIGIGHHARFGGDHAEVAALKNCREATAGATMHVTLEPCSHFGKTPPCVDAIITAGLRRVVVAVGDPNPRVNGQGLQRLRENGIAVELWESASEIARDAYLLNLPFFKKIVKAQPHVIAKWAMTLDGRMALATGDSRWISNDRSRAMVHELRGQVDAVMVGIGTALADDPALTARPPGPRSQLRIVIDPRAQLPLASHLATTARESPVWLLVAEVAPAESVKALEQAGCRVIRLLTDHDTGAIDPQTILDFLGSEGLTNILLEGGSRTLGRFFAAGAIDEVQVFIAPKLFGGPPRFTPVDSSQILSMENVPELIEITRREIGDDTLVRGIVPNRWISNLLSS